MTDHIPIEPKAAIFDMDGLLLDTEPLWEKSMLKIAEAYQIPIDPAYFKVTTGLRIYEVTALWKNQFPWEGDSTSVDIAEAILDEIIAAAKKQRSMMPGAVSCIQFLRRKGLKIGLATSSPMRMVQELIPAFGLPDLLDVLTSADTAKVGKPHPEVFLQCADSLKTPSWQCIAFEDSVNGMIAAKAARMKTIIVPDPSRFDDPKFGIADMKLKSLTDFNDEVWNKLSK
jgi:sugar-phosphatase